MELDKLVIEISADDARFVQTLASLKNGLVEFGKQGAASADEVAKALRAVEKAALNTNDAAKKKELVDAYVKLNTELQRVKKEFRELTKVIPQVNTEEAKVSKTSRQVAKDFGEVDQAARRARIALYGTNQIVRDLPFGFIAISNNIPVALDQFQELIKETGGVDKAFKSLGGAMLGAGGLSIAFSALTSLAVTLIQQYGSLANAINTIFDLVDKDTVALIKQRDAYAEVTAGIKGETTNIQSLVTALTNAEGSYNSRINAYNELKRIAPGVIQDLTLENALTEDGSRVIKNRSLDLINYIQLKGREAALIKLVAEEEEKGLKATQQLIRQVTGEGRTWVDTLQDAAQAAIFQNPISALKSTSKEIINASKQTTFWSKSLDGVRKQILEFDGLVTGQVSFTDILNEQERLRREQDEKNRKGREQRLKDIASELNARIAALKAEVDAKKAQLKTLSELSSAYVAAQIEIANKEYQIGVLNAGKQIKSQKELNAALIFLQQELEAKKANIINSAAAARFAAADAELEARKKAVQAELDFIDQTTNEVLGKPDAINKRISESFRKLGEDLKAQEEQQKLLLESYRAFAEQIANSIANIGGDLVQGILDGKSAVDVLRQSLKGLIADLAAAATKAIALKAIQSVLGVAAQAAGGGFNPLSILSLGFLGRGAAAEAAQGGLRTEGVVQGPGGIALAGNVTFIQRGTDLIGVLNRTNNRIGRVG